jgi:hypothetical protein
VRPADCRIRVIPDPNTPANPVPDPKLPTTVLGNPLQNPRVVLSPRALTVPRMTDATKDNQKEALTVLKVHAKAIIRKPMSILQEVIIILLKCLILIRNFPLTSLVMALNSIKDL